MPKLSRIQEKIRGADAILIAIPEHNYSITAILKNAIRMGQQPPRDASWSGNPLPINQRLNRVARRSESPAALDR